jgi:amino acid adenylation domain-containing protein
VAAVLGVLKASCAYLPIDPSFPAERLAYMIEHAGVQRGLVTPAHARAECVARIERLIVGEPDTRPCARPERAAAPSAAAYVIYTSGSTGRPKGIVMPHAPLASLMAWQCARSEVGPGDATAHVSAFSFDVSCQELFSTWSSGGKLVIAPEAERRDVRALLQLLRAERVARVFVPVVLLHELAEISAQLELDLPALREIITAGEQLEITPAVRAFFARHPACRLDNQYGPSETHVATAQPLAAEPAHWPLTPAIGRPLPGVRAYVVDAQQKLAPIGVPGELLLAGSCVADGYIADPELTAERFGRDPFAPSARSYATGDLARWLPDGTLEFLGRRDAQVKIRGYRVELAEVEATILAAADGCVRRAAVVVQPGGRQLAAYVQCAPGAQLDRPALERALARRLPAPMLPSVIAELERLPLTPSGKLDRRALPALTSLAGTNHGHVAPETPLEIELCGLWQDVLEVSQLGVTDDFFATGGDSLRAVRLMARVQRRYGLELPIAALIEAPSVRQLARAIAAAPATASAPRAAIMLHAGKPGDTPLFCVHPVGGNVLCYMPLARRLGSTCYALQARGLDGRSRPHTSVVEMASAYAAEIAHKQPSGPLHIAGWSFGGVVALEIARQLRHAGRELGPLLVLDSIASVKWQVQASDDALLECMAMELLGTQVDDALFQSLFVEPGDRSDKLQKLLAAARARGLDADGGDTGRLEHVFAIIQNNIRAAYDYRPASYAGEVVLLRCQDPMPARLLRMHDMIGSVYDAPDNGWGALCPQLRVVPVRGDHLSLVFEPYVEQVADAVRSILPRRDHARAAIELSV